MGANEARTIVRLFKRTQVNMGKNFKQNCAQMLDFHLTYPQMSLLFLLNHNQKMRIGDISRQLGLTNSTVSGIVDRLEKMDMVKRIRNSEDRRVVKVALTKKVLDFTQDMDRQFEQYVTMLFKDVSTEDMEIILQGLEKLDQVITGNEQI